MSDIKNPSVLAFERKLDPSDALFYAGKWEDREDKKLWSPVIVREKAVRGTISNRLKTKGIDSAKLDADVQKANLQRVDVAMLPNDCDTLKIRFTLRVLGNIGLPSACNNTGYQEKLLKTVEWYKAEYGFNELAKRYAYNLACGRFLWRNRLSAEQIDVYITNRSERANTKTWRFNALDLSLRHFEPNDAAKLNLEALSQSIVVGLSGKHYVLLDIEAYARIGEGQETFPSQELVLDKNKNQKGKKSKTLYQVNEIAAMHSQKIGNALRTIDTWYSDETGMGPISIEPYGSVTSQGKAYRQPNNKIDFYSLLDNWMIKDRVPDVSSQHFIMATLIRGGVFGESGKE